MLVIPDYINEKIQKVSSHFGENIQDIIETSIYHKSENLDENTINILNGIFNKKDTIHKSIKISLEEMTEPISNHLKFWDSILEQSNLNDIQKKGVSKIKAILEVENEAKSGNKESIESDGEDPDMDESSSQSQEEQQPQVEQPLTPEQQMQIELTQTDNKFMTITLYNSINGLINTIETLLGSVSASRTEENLDLFTELNQYKEYLDILAELIFVMDLNTVYFNFTNISLEVNSLLDKYLISTKVKILNNKDTTPQAKQDILDDLKNNLASKIETNEEIQDEQGY